MNPEALRRDNGVLDKIEETPGNQTSATEPISFVVCILSHGNNSSYSVDSNWATISHGTA